MMSPRTHSYLLEMSPFTHSLSLCTLRCPLAHIRIPLTPRCCRRGGGDCPRDMEPRRCTAAASPRMGGRRALGYVFTAFSLGKVTFYVELSCPHRQKLVVQVSGFLTKHKFVICILCGTSKFQSQRTRLLLTIATYPPLSKQQAIFLTTLQVEVLRKANG